MKADLELFALLAAVLLAVMGALFFLAAFKEKAGDSSGLFIKSSLVLFVIAGMFLIPGWDYLYTSGFWQRPATQESKPSIAPASSPQPIVAGNSQKTEQPAAQPVDPVNNNGWDGSVRQVKEWLKDNLKDPGSFQAIEWSPVRKTSDGGYVVRCKYRAKNSLGGYDIANQIFYMDSGGKVLRYEDVNY